MWKIRGDLSFVQDEDYSLMSKWLMDDRVLEFMDLMEDYMGTGIIVCGMEVEIQEIAGLYRACPEQGRRLILASARAMAHELMDTSID